MSERGKLITLEGVDGAGKSTHLQFIADIVGMKGEKAGGGGRRVVVTREPGGTEIGEEIRGALERFAGDVRSGAFPTEEHTYAMPAEELEAFLSSPTPPARTGT